MNMQWIVAPIVGCVIGYLTNWVAIKMLFRPLRARHIAGFRVPFTPGMIPKEKHRLAVAIGDGISRDLLSADIVKGALLSDAMLEKIEADIDALIERCASDERTLGELAEGLAGGEAQGRSAAWLGAVVTDVLTAKLLEAKLGDVAGKAIVDHIKRKSPPALAGLISGLLDERIKSNIVAQLGEGVDSYLRDNGATLIRAAVDGEADKLMGTRLCELATQHADRLPALKRRLMDGYRGLVSVGTERALRTADLSAIVQSRVEQLNERELEAMILGVVDRELNAIVWLGALLGFLMGFVNLLFA